MPRSSLILTAMLACNSNSLGIPGQQHPLTPCEGRWEPSSARRDVLPDAASMALTDAWFDVVRAAPAGAGGTWEAFAHDSLGGGCQVAGPAWRWSVDQDVDVDGQMLPAKLVWAGDGTSHALMGSIELTNATGELGEQVDAVRGPDEHVDLVFDWAWGNPYWEMVIRDGALLDQGTADITW
jgi:hypothetical protein